MSDVSRGRLLVVSAASAVIVLSFVVPAGAVGVPAAVIAPAGSRPGHPAGPDDRITAGDSRLLPSPARGTRAVESLGSALDVAAARNGYTPDRLAGLLRADPTAWLDRDGRLFYVEPTPSVTAKVAVGAGQGGAASSVATPYPLSDTFTLHSKPDSTKTIYLDFTGQRVAGTVWNQNSGLPDGVYEPWSLDSNGNDFNDSERATIQSVWQRVAEDYAAFDVDVTTQDPGSDALTRSSAGDQTFGTRALITPSQVARQAVCGGSCGGVAYVGTFDAIVASPEYVQPAWIFSQGLGPNNDKFMAEAVSHEVGHTLGLAHDGTSTLGYYAGQGSWAPIMGVGYGKPITQWSRGDYADANNLQDDYAVMQANGLARRADEAGGATGTAAVLNGTTVDGHITDRLDQDVWSVNRGCSTPFDVTVTPAPNAPDLDIRLDVLDAAGDVVETSDPPSGGTGDIATGMSAVLRDQIRPGQFYLRVDGVGSGDPLGSGYSDYGSIGAYTLTMSHWCAAVAPGAPSEPQALAVEQDDRAGSATLSWDVPVSQGGSPISGYAVTRDGFDVAALDTTDRSYVFTGLPRGDTTTLGVRAINANGDGMPGLMPTRLAPAPKAPESVRATRASRQATMRWAEPDNAARADVTGYVVRSYTGDSLLATRTLGPDARSYRWTRLTNGKHYVFRVAALSGHFTGATAGTGTVTPATRPGRPVIGAASVPRRHVIKTTWRAPRWDGGARVTAYLVQASRLGPSGRVVQRLHMHQVGPGQHAYAVRVARTGRWSFQVWAVNPMGRSDASAWSNRVWVR